MKDARSLKGIAEDLVCFSHLRWGFVYQRPQHLISRWARICRVWFVEEPHAEPSETARLEYFSTADGVTVVTPHLPAGVDVATVMPELLKEMMTKYEIRDFVAWYYTPLALDFTRSLEPRATIYDCMDELSSFKGASPALKQMERELCSRADLVFTGGLSLYEAKRFLHRNVHAFPSAVDLAHFARAREPQAEPADQAAIAHPRLGFHGVIDERLDIELVGELAAKRPDWHIVMLGPVVKIDPATLPQAANIHWLGSKSYDDLPAYLSGWDVAIMPFARNEATRFISPTKTPEYLAGGLPVVSTSIRDVVRTYGEAGLAEIADTATEFESAVVSVLASDATASSPTSPGIVPSRK
jgi:UDP-galactopyranose mutase